MTKKLTITVADDVYEGLHAVVGRGAISKFLSNLARPLVVKRHLANEYRRMASDEVREQNALEWSDALIVDVADDPR